jgi:hypothetical protein
MDTPPAIVIPTSVGLKPADDETELSDVQALARRLRAWGNSKLTFPYREGDPVEVVITVQLRQTMDLHQVENTFKGIVVGLTLFILSPFVGGRLTEIHDVEIRSTRKGRLIGQHRFEMRTDVTMGYAADAQAAAKDLNDEQMNRIAKRVVELVLTDIAKSNATWSHVRRRFG